VGGCARLLGRQRTFDRLGRQFLQGVFDPPEFALKLAHKDVDLATERARARRADAHRQPYLRGNDRSPQSRMVRARLAFAMLLQEERAGVESKCCPRRFRP
jgi:3-hydroxyisobutyrate dehydrogenase